MPTISFVGERGLLVACALLALTPSCTGAPAPLEHPPLERAHSHNDYHRPRPLQDALDLGFCSVEVDIWLVDDKLLVGHTVLELRPERTLEALYLDPLARRVKDRHGWVYDRGRPLMLLVDFKTNGVAAYEALRKRLTRYAVLFSPVQHGLSDAPHSAPIQVIITGNRPLELFDKAPPHIQTLDLAALDGRLTDVKSTLPADVMPLISDNWAKHFTWRGKGPMPADERQQLHDYVRAAHKTGRKIRFWATPDNRAVWEELYAADVDLIGADDLKKLADFFASPSGD